VPAIDWVAHANSIRMKMQFVRIWHDLMGWFLTFY
jgi:hypothetical protein